VKAKVMPVIKEESGPNSKSLR